jgi:NADP-dependent 3-hydroxy acid dehydrogenase YdfG
VALGAKVTIMARNQEALQAAAEEIRRTPEASTSTPLQEAVVHIEAVDVMDEDLLQAGIASAVEALGRVDFIVPCAGTAL